MSERWTTLSSRSVYENPWIRVREDRVLRPDGRPGLFGVVSPRGFAVGVVAVDEHRQVHLVGQYRYAISRYSWEIPEGGARPGESPLEAARRELREETALGAHTFQALGGPIFTNNAVTDEIAYLFLATDLYRYPSTQPDEEEVLSQRTLPLAEAVAMASEGELEDALTVIGLLRARARTCG